MSSAAVHVLQFSGSGRAVPASAEAFSGSAVSNSASIFSSRALIDSFVRLRPRFGGWIREPRGRRDRAALGSADGESLLVVLTHWWFLDCWHRLILSPS